MSNLDLLLTPYVLNNQHTLKNRIVMAPMTRTMASDDLVPTKAMADYYARRADAGLIITEGTIIRPDGKGYDRAPGIFSDEQVNAWKQVTKSVHNNKGKIFSQIWHVGRVSHPYFLNGELPLSPSETRMKNRIARSSKENPLFYGKSREVSLDEIQDLINSYAIAANNAMDAGFDGIEIHAANGYLVDQFLHYNTNRRDDSYGGTPENMSRFALEVVKACGDKIGYNNVGIRLSPGGYLNEIVGDKRDAQVFEYLLKQLNTLSLAYVHTGNFDDSVKFSELNDMTMTQFLRTHYHGNLIASGSYTFEEALSKIQANEFDLLAIGRKYIANPDLISRLQNQEQLHDYDASMLNTLY